MTSKGRRSRKSEELTRGAVFSRNLKSLLMARGPNARDSIQRVCGVPLETVDEWVDGFNLPEPTTLRSIVRWAGLPMRVDLTRERLIHIEKSNAIKIRKEWICRIGKLSDADVLELKPGIDRILPE
jgi:hypothetical protein